MPDISVGMATICVEVIEMSMTFAIRLRKITEVLSDLFHGHLIE